MSELKRVFGSVIVAMVTPFHADGSVDIPTARRLARHLVDQGCDGIVLNGTTGESPTTHQPEKDELVAAVVEEVGSEAFITAGAGSNDTAHAVRIAKGAKRSGAHGVLVLPPYYNRPSQEGVYRHMRAVIEAAELPAMLYDIPGRTGVRLEDATLDRLAALEPVLAVKDATGNVAHGFDAIARTGLEFYSGDDGLNFAWLAHGAAGVVSVVGHVAAAQYKQLVSLVDGGDLAGARAVARDLRDVVAAVMGTGQGAVMAKHALHLQGILPTPTLRLPLVEAPQADVDNLADVLRAHSML
ncbi:4-hydroxy-tetrahydrodipicolinate synthase [Buchananella felis]|uniref:4-hydroxy-tetrahydrodipicolinate synthase n=1 Tax=Buchananella felis TaxID=3231492 RepID=UPI003528F0CE